MAKIRIKSIERRKITMRRNAIETLLGGVVLMVAIVFMFFALQSAQVSGVKGV